MLGNKHMHMRIGSPSASQHGLSIESHAKTSRAGTAAELDAACIVRIMLVVLASRCCLQVA